MSKDCYIFFNIEKFPIELWEQIISDFNYYKIDDTRANISNESGPIWVSKFQPGETSILKEKCSWVVHLAYQAPYEPMKLYLVYSLAYQCMCLIEGITFQAPSGETLENIETLEEFASEDLIKNIGLGKLNKLGLLTKNERVKF